MRVTVGMIVEAHAAGRTIDELLADFPYLEERDIREALAFAASLAQGHEICLADRAASPSENTEGFIAL